ncbi:MAG TPA: hypothetical protein VEY50_10955 [Lysobacter sp.]|nr:hypothetical protein [Lysobacter sp.]
MAVSGCQPREPVRPAAQTPLAVGPAETGPETSCEVDTDCWCRSFDGARFLPEKAPSRCENNRCATCYYE